jgi:hypothetical protein
MNRALPLALLLAPALALTGCAEDAESTELEAIGRGGSAKIGICHWDEDAQSYDAIEVSTNGWSNGHAGNHANDELQGSWYSDLDGDGAYGTTATTCPETTDHSADEGDDCDDADADTYPGADELEDGIDNDCDGWTDEGIACPLWDAAEAADYLNTDADYYWGGHWTSYGSESFQVQAAYWAPGFWEYQSGFGWEWVSTAPTHALSCEVWGEDDYHCGEWTSIWTWYYYHGYGFWDGSGTYGAPGTWDFTEVAEEDFELCKGILEDQGCSGDLSWSTWDGASHCD